MLAYFHKRNYNLFNNGVGDVSPYGMFGQWAIFVDKRLLGRILCLQCKESAKEEQEKRMESVWIAPSLHAACRLCLLLLAVETAEWTKINEPVLGD